MTTPLVLAVAAVGIIVFVCLLVVSLIAIASWSDIESGREALRRQQEQGSNDIGRTGRPKALRSSGGRQ